MIEVAKWIEGKYNISYLRLGDGLDASVAWTYEGYEIEFLGYRYKNNFQDGFEARTAAVKLIQKILSKGLKKLPISVTV